MCDATTLISTKQTDLHSCWIIYTKSDGKERLTVTDAKQMMDGSGLGIGIQQQTNAELELEDGNDDTDQSLTDMLDPELQPEQPIPNNQQSQQIYREHRRLAKEYLRVDTKLYYAQDFKEKLLLQMDPAERQEKKELLKKISEKEELMELLKNLKKQLEKTRLVQAQEMPLATEIIPTQQLQQQHQQIRPFGDDVVADDGWVVIAPDT